MVDETNDNSRIINAAIWRCDLRELQELAEKTRLEWEETERSRWRDIPTNGWLRENGYYHIQPMIQKLDGLDKKEFSVDHIGLEQVSA